MCLGEGNRAQTTPPPPRALTFTQCPLPWLAAGQAPSTAAVSKGSPQDGVDLESLDPAKASGIAQDKAQEAYERALEAVGGLEGLARFAQPMRDLQEKAVRHSSKGQHSGFSVLDLPQYLQAIASPEMREFGIERLRQFEAQMPRCTVSIPNAKGFARAEVKVVIKYGGNFLLLVDVNRVTIVCATSEDLFDAVKLAVETWKSSTSYIVEFEDHYFGGEMRSGYRHVQLVASFCGILWEVQFNTWAFVDAKGKVGHQSYKTERYVQEQVLYCGTRNKHAELHELLSRPGVSDIADATLIRDQQGRTSLHHAAFHGNTDLLDLLLGMRRGVWVACVDARLCCTRVRCGLGQMRRCDVDGKGGGMAVTRVTFWCYGVEGAGAGGVNPCVRRRLAFRDGVVRKSLSQCLWYLVCLRAWQGGLSTAGAGSIEPPKLGWGSGKRAQLTGPLISYYEHLL